MPVREGGRKKGGLLFLCETEKKKKEVAALADGRTVSAGFVGCIGYSKDSLNSSWLYTTAAAAYQSVSALSVCVFVCCCMQSSRVLLLRTDEKKGENKKKVGCYRSLPFSLLWPE